MSLSLGGWLVFLGVLLGGTWAVIRLVGGALKIAQGAGWSDTWSKARWGAWGIIALVVLVLSIPALVYFTREYFLTVTYPAAVYTEDGKKIVFLERRQLTRQEASSISLPGTSGKTVPLTLSDKTYLGVMDRYGRKKTTVAEVTGNGLIINSSSYSQPQAQLLYEHIGRGPSAMDQLEKLKLTYRSHGEKHFRFFKPFWWDW